jgi:hypothetical protein
LGAAGFGLMTDSANDVGLIALIVYGIAHGFSISGQEVVLFAIGMTEYGRIFRKNYRRLILLVF